MQSSSSQTPNPEFTTQDATNGRSYPPQSVGFYLQLSVFWFANSLLWSGLITIVMQHLVKRMAGDQKDLYLGYALGLGALVSTVVCLVAGTLSDRTRSRWGRRRPFVFWGTLASVPILIGFAYVQNMPQLILMFCLIQWWVNVGTSPYQALVPDMVPRSHHGTASAFMGMSGLLGTTGGLLLCGLLIERPGGLLIIMSVLATLLLLTMLWTMWRIKETPTLDEDAPQSTLGQAMIDSFRVNPRQYPDFFWLIASRVAINLGFYSATEFLSYYVADTLRAPNPTQTVMQLFLLTTISSLVGNFPAGLLADRMSKKLVVYISLAITGVAALVFLLANSISMAFIAALFFGAGFGAFAAVDWALATNLLPEHDEAKYMGVWHAAFTVPQVVAPVIGGAVAYVVNTQVGQGAGYRAVLFMVLLYLVIGAMLIRPIRERN